MFKPNYVIPPCVFIKEEMKILKISKRKFIKLSGLDKNTVKNILKCKIPISDDIAEILGNVLYSPKQYWLNLQALCFNRLSNTMCDILGVPQQAILEQATRGEGE